MHKESVSLSMQELTIAYNQPVIESVTLDIPAQAVTGIIGPSGCGKSSLLMSINYLAQEQGAQVTGALNCFGQPLFKLKPTRWDLMQLRRKIGYIFQRPNPFPMSIYQNLDMPLKEHGVKKKDRAAKIENSLKAVGLWSEVHQRLSTNALALSGGQQQRLCMARALVLEPDILLMDEPCSALDPIAGAVIEELIVQLKNTVTIVIVTHNLAQAKRVADKVAFFWMNQAGFLVESAPTQQLFTEPQSKLTQAYLSAEL